MGIEKAYLGKIKIAMDETRIRALAVLPARGGSKGVFKKMYE